MSFMPQGSTPSTASFTCNTCGIRFVTADLQRQHMKTEWHRYNLKRRVAQLPSISSDVFAEKVLQSQQVDSDNEQEDENGFFVQKRQRSSNPKQPTKKSIRQQQRLAALQRGRHLGTNGHYRTDSPSGSVVSDRSVFTLGDSSHIPTDYESTGSEMNYSMTESEDFTDIELVHSVHSDPGMDSYIEVIPNTHCFFCGKNNHELENNVKHMFNRHGLYIPERTFLVDLAGLLSSLSEKISYDHECLVCGFEGKSLESIRQHMSSKGHCRIPYETKEEKQAIAQHYNFSVDSEPKTSLNTNTVSFAEEEEDEEEAEAAYDSNYSIAHVDRTGVELTLPNGTRLGHRTMARYYRQDIHSRELTVAEKTVGLVDKRYAPGITSREVTKQEKDTQLMVQKSKNLYERRTKQKKVNYHKNFRDEFLGILR